MASLINRKVDPDALGLGTGLSWADAFTSLNAALVAEAKNIVTADEQWDFECRSSSGTADTTLATITTFWTTDATRFIRIFATDGHQTIKTSYDTNRYRIKNIYTNVPYVKVEGIQIYGAAWSYSIKVDFTAAGWLYFDGCRINAVANSRGFDLIDADANTYIWNCVIKGSGNQIGLDIDGGDVYCYNSIVEDWATGFDIEAAAGTVEIKNVACFNNTDDFDDANASTIDHCASDDNDGTNNVAESGGGANWPSDFNDAANGDFTLLIGSNLRNAGLANPSGGLYTTDIEGDAYTVAGYSLGVDEYIAVSGNPKGVFGMPFARPFEGCFGGM